jgi:hypothetical protein
MRPERRYYMKIFPLVILSFFVLIGKINAQKDTLMLYNGQMLVGDLKDAKTGIITIDDIDLSLVKVKMYKIRRMVSFHPYRIETTERKIYIGTITPGEEDGKVMLLVNDSTRLLLSLNEINIMIPLEKSFIQRLTGNVNAGFSFAKSSGVGQINFSGLVQYATRNWTYQLSASEIASIDSSNVSRDNENLELYGSYNFNPTWFAASTFLYQRNLELSIARRLQQMIGGGNKLFVRRYWQLLAISGLAFNQELNTDGGTSGLLLEIPFMLRFNFYRFNHPNLQINTSQALFIGLTQQGRVRWSGSTSLSYQLIKNFYVTLTPYTNYDNLPPLGGNTFDFGIAFSLAYRF